jgi:CMP/dCMP kinase
MRKIKIAIDGPAGAGKSTIAKKVAGLLGYIYIDTGAMYRCIALKALENNLDLEDEEAIGVMVQNTAIELKYNNECSQLIFLDGREVTEAVRSQKVTENVSNAAKIPAVRIAMVDIQRKLAQQGGVVMDGRDIGTYVLPEAECKIFLTASVEERATRRYKELIAKGETVDFEKLKSDIALRDKIDSERDFAPLKVADDAIILDSTGLNLKQVRDKIIDLVKELTS